MPKLYIPTPMRRFTNGQSSVQLEGETVAEVLDALAVQHSNIKDQLYDEQGNLKHHIALFVNDTDIRSLSGVATSLTVRDEVHIVPAIAGG